MNHILTGAQFADKKILEKIFSFARKMEKGKAKKLLDGKIVATLFFEPSTRTRLSFEAAAMKLGAGVLSTENATSNSSSFKGETIEDTIRVVESYADIVVMRHPEQGSAGRAAKASRVPIVNAGDGANEHPTQALLDLYTIKKELGSLENKTIAFVGDLLNGRTLHSLLPLLTLYSGNNFYFVSPQALKLPERYKQGIKFKETSDLNEALKNSDVVYITRVQKERFVKISDYEKVKDVFLLKPEHLKIMKKKSIIMHPLPRVNEIDSVIDADPRASYFRQAKNGLYVRMAILLYALGRI